MIATSFRLCPSESGAPATSGRVRPSSDGGLLCRPLPCRYEHPPPNARSGDRAVCAVPAAAFVAGRVSAQPAAAPIYFFALTGVNDEPQVRPRQIVFNADGNNDVTGLRWAHWGASSTTSNGTDHINNCRPNCAKGNVTRVKTYVHLYRPGRFHHRRMYLCHPGHLP